MRFNIVTNDGKSIYDNLPVKSVDEAAEYITSPRESVRISDSMIR